MRLGNRKMPEPMTMPMMISAASNDSILRGKSSPSLVLSYVAGGRASGGGLRLVCDDGSIGRKCESHRGSKHGLRPSFETAAMPQHARKFYQGNQWEQATLLHFVVAPAAIRKFL